MPLIKFTSGSPVGSDTWISARDKAQYAASFGRSTFVLSEQNAQAMEHTGLIAGECPACLAMRATTNRETPLTRPFSETVSARMKIDPDFCAELGENFSGSNNLPQQYAYALLVATDPKTETVTINGLPYHRLIATDTPSEGMAGKADEVMKGILDGTLSRPKVKQIGDAVAERTKKDSGGDALGGAIGRSIRHGSFMERRTPYSD